MILEENKIYSFQDLAEWFGIKPKSFSATKEKKFQLLTQFCEFEEVSKTKIKVTKVIDPIFSKEKVSNKRKVREAMQDLWGSGNGRFGLDTDTNVTNKIVQSEKYNKLTITPKTTSLYVGDHRRKDRDLVWKWQLAKFTIDPETGIKTYIDFTPEELLKKKQIWKRLFMTPQVEKLRQEEQLAYEAYRNNEIQKAEYADKVIDLKEQTFCLWLQYKQEVAEMTNCFVERCAAVTPTIV